MNLLTASLLYTHHSILLLSIIFLNCEISMYVMQQLWSRFTLKNKRCKLHCKLKNNTQSVYTLVKANLENLFKIFQNLKNVLWVYIAQRIKSPRSSVNSSYNTSYVLSNKLWCVCSTSSSHNKWLLF